MIELKQRKKFLLIETQYALKSIAVMYDVYIESRELDRRKSFKPLSRGIIHPPSNYSFSTWHRREEKKAMILLFVFVSLFLFGFSYLLVFFSITSLMIKDL